MATNFSLYKFLRRQIFKIVYPAQVFHTPANKEFINYHVEFYNSYSPNHSKQQITFKIDGDQSSQGISAIRNIDDNEKSIDAVLISKRNSSDKNKMFLIHCDGNLTCYEVLSYQLEQFASSGYVVIGFNPMGVGYSKGVTNGPEDYEKSLTAIIENLRLNGVPAENIVLSGRSLGAAIVTNVAAKYQIHNLRLRVINDRSFANLDSVSASFAQSLIPTKFLRNSLGLIIYYIVKKLIDVFNLNINAEQSFTKTNTINPGDALCLCVENDEIINKKDSLFYNLKPEMQKFASSFVCLSDKYVHNAFHDDMIGPINNLTNDIVSTNCENKSLLSNAGNFVANYLKRIKAESDEIFINSTPDKIEYLVKDLINILNSTTISTLKASTTLSDSLTNHNLNKSLDKIIEISDCLIFLSDEVGIKIYSEDNILNFMRELSDLHDYISKIIESKKVATEASIASKNADNIMLGNVEGKYSYHNDFILENAKFNAAQCKYFAATKLVEARKLEAESKVVIEKAFVKIRKLSIEKM